MSEPQQNVRVRLGPVASALIEGSTENRQDALDRAILALQEQAASGPQPEGRGQLMSRLEEQSALLSALRAQVMTEMQMTRVLIAALMADTDDDKQLLLTFVMDAMEKLRRETGLVLEEEQRTLDRKEAAFWADRQQRHMQQGGPEIERDQEQEIER